MDGAASSNDACYVRFWPKADIPVCTAHVRLRGKSGHFCLQSDTQAPQVANCHFMSAFSGVKRTWAGAVQMSAFDPKRALDRLLTHLVGTATMAS